MKNGVVGSTYKWPKLAAGVATERTPQTDVTPLNTAFSQVSVTLADWSASEYSDIFNNAKVSFEERNELAQVVGSAVGRRYDQLIIDALTNASAGSTVANTVVTSGSATASDLNVGKLIAAKKALDAKNVPQSDRHFICHANNLAGLLGDERAVSSDYNQIRAFDPYPGAYAILNGKRIKLFGAQKAKDFQSDKSKVGQIIISDNNLIIKTNTEFISVSNVQLEGKKKVSSFDFTKTILDKEYILE